MTCIKLKMAVVVFSLEIWQNFCHKAQTSYCFAQFLSLHGSQAFPNVKPSIKTISDSSKTLYTVNPLKSRDSVPLK